MSAVFESAVREEIVISRRSWLDVLVIAFGAFAMVFAELLPVGLLPGISGDLRVQEGTAGMIVAITALFAFLAAPATALAVGRIDRRQVLLGLTLLTIVSSVISVLAPNFSILFAARVLLGIALGGFWTVSVPAAARLLPVDKAHIASMVVMSGISIAAVLAVPAGTLIGAYFDWRVAFVAATVIAVLALLLQLMYLPGIVMDEHVALKDLAAVLKSAGRRAGGSVSGGNFARFLPRRPGCQRQQREERHVAGRADRVPGHGDGHGGRTDRPPPQACSRLTPIHIEQSTS